MKKILIIGMYNQIGGVENFTMNFYRKINNEFNFEFICMHEHIAFEEEILKSSKIHYISNVKKHPMKYYKELKMIMKNEKYDVVHINMLSAANIIPLIIAKKAKIKNIIAHSHNSSLPQSKLKKVLHKINKNIITKCATTLVACSEQAGRWLFGENKFIILKNAIEVKKYKYNEKYDTEIRKKYNLDNKKVYGLVGRFSEEKNHVYLLEMFKEIKQQEDNSCLLLIGSGNTQNTVKAKITELGLESSVIIIDETYDVNKYYSSMNYFILPSIFEGLGIVTIEAQAAGLQCFVSEAIPEEANIAKEFVYFNVNQSAKDNANLILKHRKELNRNLLYEKIKSSEYNIEKEVNELKKIYMGEYL